MKINGIFRYSVIQQLPNRKQLRVDTGSTNNKNFKIYSLYEGGKLKKKLSYVSTDLDNWYATKLKSYEEEGVKEDSAFKRMK